MASEVTSGELSQRPAANTAGPQGMVLSVKGLGVNIFGFEAT